MHSHHPLVVWTRSELVEGGKKRANQKRRITAGRERAITETAVCPVPLAVPDNSATEEAPPRRRDRARHAFEIGRARRGETCGDGLLDPPLREEIDDGVVAVPTHQHDAEEPPSAKPRRPVGDEIGATHQVLLDPVELWIL